MIVTIICFLLFVAAITFMILFVQEKKKPSSQTQNVSQVDKLVNEVDSNYHTGRVWTDYFTKPVLNIMYSSYDITVLMPVRSTRFVKSLSKLMSQASQPHRIQVVLRCDDDDDSIRTVDFNDIHNNIQVITGPRLRGYDSAHVMYTEMLNTCSGKVLMMWNDDADMLSNNWDEIIYELLRRKHRDIMVWHMKVINDPEAPIFPIITRQLFVKTGCYSGHYENDTFLNEAWKRLGNEFTFIDIEINHNNDGTFATKGLQKDNYVFDNRDLISQVRSISYSEAMEDFLKKLK